MEIRWSPQKRIKLDKGKSSKATVKSAENPQPLSLMSSTDPDASIVLAGKRNSSDFDKELDECLEVTESAFNPTQVFLVDPEMELAMLRVDMDMQSSMSTPHESCKSTQNRVLSRWDTAPLFETAKSNVKRHASEPFFQIPQTILVDELDGIDISELSAIADGAQHAYVFQPSVSTQDSTSKKDGLFYSRSKVLDIKFASDTVVLGVFDEKNVHLTQIFLTGVWFESLSADPWQLQVGDTIDLLKSRAQDDCNYGDSTSLFPDIVVFHPEIFISSTTLSGSANCHRKSVLQNRIVSPQLGPIPTDAAEISRAIAPIVGNCVHEALQAAAVAGDFSPAFIRQAGNEALTNMMLPAVWLSGASPQTILSHLESRVPAMQIWGEQVWPKIATKLLGCETEVKGLGISGKLDMDIEDVAGARSCIEIKTGKQSHIHVGQIVLYYLLEKCLQKSDQQVASKMFLLYLPALGPAETIEHTISARECQNIMRNRNLLASHNVRGATLPEIVLSRECQFCPVKDECALIGKASEKKSNPVFQYMHQWLAWIDKQTDLGGLSATRRMRGNILSMVSEKSPFLAVFSKLKKSIFDSTEGSYLVAANLMSEHSVVADLINKMMKQKKRIILCDENFEKILNLVTDKSHIVKIPTRDEESEFDLPKNWAENAENIESINLLFVSSLKGVHHDIFSKANFDLAIVMDSNNVKDPYLWPLAMRARRLVLYGLDDEGSEKESLFNRIRGLRDLDTQGPDN